ncbi:MAG TPA: hypothetical protein VM056_02755 [Terriglobales bacterium]|nr:hypothetical protein [Terriglobales bacterium]
MPSRKFILCVVTDPTVRRTKQMVLEHIGFNVTAVGTPAEVQSLITGPVFDLVVVGRSVPDKAKRQIAETVRNNMSKTPILEVCTLAPVLPDADHVLHSHDPEDLASMVKAILGDRQPMRVAANSTS